MNRTRTIIAVGVLLAVSLPATAHLPIFSDGTAIGPDSAIFIQDATLSQVVYHELADGNGQLWIAFDAQAGQQGYFQLGVPQIDRLQGYRPAVTVLGPGLPPVDVPFAVPAGLGGITLSVGPNDPVEDFFEHFTGTSSWILGKLDFPLPASGRYYAVVWSPNREPGKLWLAIGKREEFGLDDVAALRGQVNQVRAFHEISATPFPSLLPFMGAAGMVLTVCVISRRKRTAGQAPQD